jgi:hypothetical protein
LIHARDRDLWRAATEADNTETAAFFGHKRSLGCFSDQLTDGLTKRQPTPRGVRFGDLHRIVLELECGSRHAIIIT